MLLKSEFPNLISPEVVASLNSSVRQDCHIFYYLRDAAE